MKKFIITLSSMILLTIAPFPSFYAYGESLKPAYTETFLGELNPKFNRLKNETEKKIIFIGGSSLPFGLKSDYLETSLGYKVINFGLYASLGTTMMMELSKVNIKKDDIIVLAPEIDKQTYDVYFNPLASLQALETNKSMKKYLSVDENMDMYYNYYTFILQKKEVLKKGIDLTSLGVYTINSFNEYGDIIYPRNSNIMNRYSNSPSSILINQEMMSESFIKFTKKYKNYVEKKGAKFIFSFSPVNRLGINKESNYSSLEDKIKEEIKCDLLGSISNFVYNEKYFYDTNYHLNDYGQIMHSKNLNDLLCEKYSIENNWNIEIPEPPTLEEEEEEQIQIDYFNITTTGKQVSISSIKEEYKESIKEIVVPEQIDGASINSIGMEAFKGCSNLEKITLPSTIESIGMKAFSECHSLKEVYIKSTTPPIISVGLFSDARSDLKIYVPKNKVTAYKNNYSWMEYASIIYGF